jgi:uncharacterized protein (DUF983 family)
MMADWPRPSSDHQIGERRAAWPAIQRGLKGQCPACGQGRIFGKFLKVKPSCDTCGEAFHHHRADDLPPYLVIVIVGHMIGALILLTEVELDLGWPTWIHVFIWPLLTLGLSVALIQPIKGAVISLQWAMRMHGFGNPHDEEDVLRPLAYKTHVTKASQE